MESLHVIEDKLGMLFKNVPELPESNRKKLADIWPWLALIFGILQLWSAWMLWQAGHAVDRLVDWSNNLSASYGIAAHAPHLGPAFYIAVLVLIVDAVILLLAYPKLKARQKLGWDLIFLGTLLNLLYGIVATFTQSSQGGGVTHLFSALLGSAIAFYLLYQVRSYYSGVVGARLQSKTPDPQARHEK